MFTPEQIETQLQRILLKVQKPGRYVGGEYNTIFKPWEETPLKVALVFPDIYDIGVSNVGLKILYDQINQRSDALAERAYAPWVDMEAEMRAAGLPLYSLETHHPLAAFDLIGFSLPYETLYTNTLNILDLAGLPLRSQERDERHPLIIAGGHATTNPEPMHAFIDAFAIGEGEEIIHDILNMVKKAKEERWTRPELLRHLARIPGLYVPRFYEVSYFEDGTVREIHPTIPEAPKLITKRMVAKLPPP
ncbi:MAG: B12-binding domain-containing radical SAM protein, partial [Anaerolineales bacterium]